MKLAPLSLLIVIACTAIFTLSACQQESAPQSKAKKPRQPHLISVLQAQAKPVATTHTRTGTVSVKHLARIFAQEEGRVTAFPWYEGDQVNKGDLLVKLDDTLLQAELKKSRADARQAQLDLKRIRNLTKKNVASEEELSRSITAVSVSQAEVEILKTRLAYTNITAPFDAVVSERLVETEDFVTKKTHLLTLINPSSLYIKANISELLLTQLDNGMPVEIRIDALDNEIFKGTIQRIHPVIDEQTRQAVIEIQFDQLPPAVRSGQFARVTFTTRERPRILVPFNAIQHDKNGEYIYLYSDGKAIKNRIRSGIKIDDQIEIIEGIKENQQIIVKGFLGLSDGKPVKLANG